MTRRVVARVLGNLGHVTIAVDDGAKAVDKALSEVLDLALIDIEMPQLDGFAAAKAIREEEHKRGRAPLQIIGMTGWNGHASACLEAGMNHYINKPLSPAKLLVVLDGMMGDSPIDVSRFAGNAALLQEALTIFARKSADYIER